MDYKKTFALHGSGIKSLQWNNYTSASSRYRELVTDLDFSDRHILDVGCGFGDLLPFIRAKTRNFHYTGVDRQPEFVAEAQKRYPDYDFIEGDYLTKPSKQKYDIIMCSGVLNAKREDYLDFRKEAVTLLFSRAKEAAAFNMAGHFPQPENKASSNIFYANAQTILDHCFTLTNKIIFRQSYSTKDFTVILFH